MRDDELQKQIDKIIQDANAELMAALAAAKGFVKNKAEEVLQQIQSEKFDDSDFRRNIRFIGFSLLTGLRLAAAHQAAELERKAEKVKRVTDAMLQVNMPENLYAPYAPPFEYIVELNKLKDIVKKKHYDRLDEPDQQPQNLPKSPEEAIKRGFVLASDNQNWYHRNKGQLGNKKYYHPVTGQEVVFDKDGKIVTIPENIGTKNYVPEPNWRHFIVDVIPYYFWGNSEDDTTPLWNRLWGPSK